MDKKGVAILLIALVMAIAAGASVYLYLKDASLAQGNDVDTVPVVVARFPKDAVPLGAYSSVDTVLDQTTKVFVVEGEPVLASKLSSIGGGLSVRIPPNMRAMSLKINEVTGVSGFVLPGDRVDVLVTIENAAGANVAVTKTILQDMEVVAAGAKTETKGNHHITVQTVTLLVGPDGAEKLALGTHQGKVHLSLRNPVDHELVAESSTDTRLVLGIKKPRRATTTRRKSTKAVVATTKKDPVPMEFTIIRDGKIVKQESPTAPDEDKK
jgi:pilus assembly protein CpaB